MAIASSARARQVGDAAIAVLAGQGARGLTHRAVDQAAGLPPGTTSNYARTRAALLTLALTRIGELETADGESQLGRPDALGGPGLADGLAAVLHRWVTDPGGRQRVLARFELALGATERGGGGGCARGAGGGGSRPRGRSGAPPTTGGPAPSASRWRRCSPRPV